MEYGIRELSELAGVSARTLRYYDEIGLLKPLYTSESGYRYYGQEELVLLQQILFYRQRGFELRQIRRILYEEEFDLMEALKDHLGELEDQRLHVDAMIRTVKQTILSMKGEYSMSDKEWFEAFKEQKVRENEEAYGKEIREKYGEEQVEASNRKLLKMSEEEWMRFQKLEAEILRRLQEAVQAGISPESEEARQIVLLHKEWLEMTWKQYTKEAHVGIAALYTADERFTQYYDREVPGCAMFLGQAVSYWVN